MEVLRPSLVYIGNRCYRKNTVASTCTDERGQFDEEDFCYVAKVDEYADESCTIDVDQQIEKTSSGYRLSMDLPNVFFKYIIGKNGETKKRLESETRTQIRIPRQNEEGNIVITGAERGGIVSARTRIDVITTSARRNIPFTHFLSLPVVGGIVQKKFDDFKADVLESCGTDRGIDATIFQNRARLHMTLGTLLLLTESEVEKASSFLSECVQELSRTVLKNKPLVARVEGLEYMNDDPAAVDVLYAKVRLVDGSNRLQMFADGLVDRFVSAGLMQREYDRVKLHITVINSLMRKDPTGATVPPPVDKRRDGRQQDRSRDRESFDATNILQLHGNYQFGEECLDTLHLSQRYCAKNNDYYLPAARISLP